MAEKNRDTKLWTFNFTESDFGTIAKTSAFVDKTLMLKDIFHSSSRILITAPPLFGKSTIINMIKRFLEIEVDGKGERMEIQTTDNYRLFKDNDLEIYKHSEFFNQHFGKYPVIHIDFKPLSGVSSFGDMLDVFRTIITDTFNQHCYLLHPNNIKNIFHFVDEFSEDDFKKYFSKLSITKLDVIYLVPSFKYLSRILFRNFKTKVFVLTDNYDAFVRSIIFRNNNPDADKINSFIHKSINSLLINNSCVERALLTGVLPVTSDEFPLHGNNLDWYSFMGSHSFSKYLGLTSDELDKVLTKLLDNDEEINKTKQTINKYYHVYTSAHNDIEVYNIWSVLHYLARRDVQCYWCSREFVTSFKPFLNRPRIQDKLKQLLSGGEIQLDLSQPLWMTDVLNMNNITSANQTEEDNTFLVLLFHFGYLSISEALWCVGWRTESLKIPNEEVKQKLANISLKNQTLYDGSQDHQNVLSCSDAVLSLPITCEEENSISTIINRHVAEEHRIEMCNISMVMQSVFKRLAQNDQDCIELLKPVLRMEQVHLLTANLVKESKIRLTALEQLSAEDFLTHLISIITHYKEEVFTPSVANVFSIMLYYLGYVSIREDSSTHFVYMKILSEEVQCKLAKAIVETNQTYYEFSPEDADNIRVALDSYQPGAVNKEQMFRNILKSVNAWYAKIANHKPVCFLYKLFMNLISSGIKVTHIHSRYDWCIMIKNCQHVTIVLTLDTIQVKSESFEPEQIFTNIFKILQDKSFKEYKTANDKLFILFDCLYENPKQGIQRKFNIEYYQIKGNNIVSKPTIIQQYYNSNYMRMLPSSSVQNTVYKDSITAHIIAGQQRKHRERLLRSYDDNIDKNNSGVPPSPLDYPPWCGFLTRPPE